MDDSLSYATHESEGGTSSTVDNSSTENSTNSPNDRQTSRHPNHDLLMQAYAIHHSTQSLKVKQVQLNKCQEDLECKAAKLIASLTVEAQVVDVSTNTSQVTHEASTITSTNASPTRKRSSEVVDSSPSKRSPDLSSFQFTWVPPEEDRNSAYNHYSPPQQGESLQIHDDFEEEDQMPEESDQSEQPHVELQQSNPVPTNHRAAVAEEVHRQADPAPHHNNRTIPDPRRPMSYEEEYYSNKDLVMISNVRDAPPTYPPSYQPCALCGELGTHFTNDCNRFTTLGDRRRAINTTRRCWSCLRPHRPPCRSNKTCPECGSSNHCIALCPRFNANTRYHQ